MNKFDLFGSQIQFRFQGQKSYTTSLGLFFTVAIACIVILRLVILLNEIYTRVNPIVLQKERQVNSPEKFIMNNKTLPFAFGMQDGITQNHYIDPSIYNIVAFELTKFTDGNQVQFKRTNATVQQCSSDNFQNQDTKSAFLNMPYQNLYCIHPEFQEVIEGDYSEPDFQYFVIQVYPCTGQGCGNTKTLGKGFFAIYFQDVIINPDIKDEPFKFYNRDLYWITSTSSPREITMYFRNNYIESDYGWVTSDIQTVRYISYSNQDVSFTQEVDYFLQLVLRFEKQKENVYQRKYKNLTNVISEIGGFTQSMLAIGFIICTKFSDFMLNKSIMKEAFNIKETTSVVNQLNQKTPTQKNIQQNPKICTQFKYQNDSQKNDNLKRQNSVIDEREKMKNFQNKINNMVFQNSQKNTPQNSQTPFLFQKNDNQTNKLKSFALLSQVLKSKSSIIEGQQKIWNSNKIQNKELFQEKMDKSYQKKKNNGINQIDNEEFLKILNQENNSMEFSILDYIKYFFWPFGEVKRKKEVIDYSIQKLYYHLDVIYIVKKLLEVDKLKQIIMDKDQIQLFEYISKPTVNEDNIFQTQNVENQQNQQPEKYNILYQDQRSEIQKIQDAYQSYQNIINSNHLSNLDQKILNHVDPLLLNLFNYQEQETSNQNKQIENYQAETIKQDKINQQQKLNDVQKQFSQNNTFSQQNNSSKFNIQINSPSSLSNSNFFEEINEDEQIPIEVSSINNNYKNNYNIKQYEMAICQSRFNIKQNSVEKQA
ncbi:ABC transporter family protein (macronuclear) [Tetrahymena thermophila SB210]|uniref:ABC transporter family protein n=1 Tax=Tetrahymena thermophila (strain SB210) TaxID=312017 RepID=W7X889_TETTS|nr:ABC transporter family protein [Tetrahymena thermophila SB210]EWS73562.1 ABC transporter family protein [Tetrahymena thermophila SB210]|eukprot:XP_012653885.1 ABC transporter family protein [Tetrahymena thermophila SB210]